mmetsp:Transcript_5147/g.11150  ORF Transcript_5147/g.11150 Transcript_5147/m.11150 type:complete len:200 (+) Transcript_5147:2733-3332(+)
MGPPQAVGHIQVRALLGVLRLDHRAPLLRGRQVAHRRRSHDHKHGPVLPAQEAHVRPRRPDVVQENEHALRREQRAAGAAVQGRRHVPVQEERLRERPGEDGEREEEGIRAGVQVEGGGHAPVRHAGVSGRLGKIDGNAGTTARAPDVSGTFGNRRERGAAVFPSLWTEFVAVHERPLFGSVGCSPSCGKRESYGVRAM